MKPITIMKGPTPALQETELMKKVLITGMSGLIGGALKDHLLEAGGYELTALNRRP